jgi:hypothetical protein
MMGDAEFYIPRTECGLHRDILDTKISTNEKRIETVEEKIDQILAMQRNTLISIISILVVCVLILVGVLLGRGIDFGLIFGVV